jgi:hypothetical protein
MTITHPGGVFHVESEGQLMLLLGYLFALRELTVCELIPAEWKAPEFSGVVVRGHAGADAQRNGSQE